ncbi:MAG TPA: hypothetical protein VKG26_11140 [Bacteroidia bacterium]|nr:hypothetical protein [Bacteroidia bacterium]
MAIKKVYKIYQTDFINREHDCLSKLDNKSYTNRKDAETALQNYFYVTEDTGEFTIISVYTNK